MVMKNHIKTVICFFILILMTCFNGKTTMAEEKAKTIVAFGDSTTAVRGNLKIYSMHLAEKFPDWEIINSGVPGNTTAMAKARFEKDVLDHKPDITIIMFGINDSCVDVWKKTPATKSRVPLTKYEENLKYFITELKKINCQVILMTPNPLRWTKKLKEMYGKPPYNPEDEDGFNVTLTKYADVVRKVAADEEVTLLDIYNAYDEYAKKNNTTIDKMLLDGMHPNKVGQKLAATMLIEELEK